MFSVHYENGVVVLQSESSKIQIWPQCGAILNNWEINSNGSVLDIIDGYESFEDFVKNCETKGFRSCKLSPYVCRMAKDGFTFDGHQYAIGKYKLGDSSIHGLIYNAVFELLYSEASETIATACFQHNYPGSDPGYPFTYTIRVTYALQSNNKVTITSEVTNTSAVHIPMADGWHPYFSLGISVNDLYLKMQAEAVVEFDEYLLPTGSILPVNKFLTAEKINDTFFDNCFLLPKPLTGSACSLYNYKDNIALHIFPENNYPYLQIYTPPHRNSIAIENLSSAPDAFNNSMGLLVIEPDEIVSFTTSYQLQNLA